MDMVSSHVLNEADSQSAEAFARLIPLLGEATPPPGPDTAIKVLGLPANTVFAARVEERIELSTGTEARIEDVVVDPAARRLGIGRALVTAALQNASSRGARHIELTSAPHREAAHTLYRSVGFAQRETGVLRRTLP